MFQMLLKRPMPGLTCSTGGVGSWMPGRRFWPYETGVPSGVLHRKGEWNGNVTQGRSLSLLRLARRSGAIPADGGLLPPPPGMLLPTPAGPDFPFPREGRSAGSGAGPGWRRATHRTSRKGPRRRCWSRPSCWLRDGPRPPSSPSPDSFLPSAHQLLPQ